MDLSDEIIGGKMTHSKVSIPDFLWQPRRTYKEETFALYILVFILTGEVISLWL